MQQIDTYFRNPKGRLKLREVDSDEAYLVYYERLDIAESRYSNYEICDIPNPTVFKPVISAALTVMGVVEKQRELWMFGNTRIHLDSVVNLGEYVELETVIRSQTKAEAQAEHQIVKDALGIMDCNLVPVSYCDLLFQ